MRAEEGCNLECCLGLSFEVLGKPVASPLTWEALGKVSCPVPTLEKLVCHHKCYLSMPSPVPPQGPPPPVEGLVSPTKEQLKTRVAELTEAQVALQATAQKGEKLERSMREHFPGFMTHEEVRHCDVMVYRNTTLDGIHNLYFTS